MTVSLEEDEQARSRHFQLAQRGLVGVFQEKPVEPLVLAEIMLLSSVCSHPVQQVTTQAGLCSP